MNRNVIPAPHSHWVRSVGRLTGVRRASSPPPGYMPHWWAWARAAVRLAVADAPARLGARTHWAAGWCPTWPFAAIRLHPYTYDTSGQVTSVSYDATNPQSATPTNPLRTVSYALDAAGNRTGVTDNGTTTSYTADSGNRYTAVGDKALTYDGRGNLATATNSLNIQQSYAYDAENRLITATNGSTVVTFAYDPAGRQVKRVENGTTTTYLLHDVSWSLLADYDGSGALTARYVHGAGTDEILTKTDGAGTVLYYHTDGLGSVTKLTNASGTVVEQYQYDIYGAVTISVPNGSGGSTILFGSNQGNRFLFTGREWIASIGLYDYRNRVYSPELGRFLQPDPIGHLGDAYNIYRYCGNDPVNNFDPSGLEYGFSWSGGYSSWLDGYSSLSSSSYNSISNTGSSGTSWAGATWSIFSDWLYPGRSKAQSSLNLARQLLGNDNVSSSMQAARDPNSWMMNQLANGGSADDVVTRFINGQTYNSQQALVDQWKVDAAFTLATSFMPVVSLERLAIREIPWSSRIVANAAKDLESGALSVRVATRSQAEELFVGKYQGYGYKNTSGMLPRETKNFFGSKYGTYHWDTPAGHGPSNPHGGLSHLQIHDGVGNIIRIFYGE